MLLVPIRDSAIGQITPDPAEVALQEAMKKETVDGDLHGAIEQYKGIAQSRNRVAAAKALLRMGQCYEKLGDPEARKAYERVLTQFPDQKDTAQEAQKRLSGLPGMMRPETLTKPQEQPTGKIGWYNGDWQSGVPGLSNWYVSETEFARVYDDFIVPEGGWTVVAVFSNSRMNTSGVTRASWEIRSGMSPGNGGKLVASGLSSATQTFIPGNGPFPVDPLIGYRIQVDDLRVQLAPGRYWLSVAPCISHLSAAKGEDAVTRFSISSRPSSYASATLGRNAIGDPPGNNGEALFHSPVLGRAFAEARTIGRGGQLGIAKDFSQGVIVAKFR